MRYEKNYSHKNMLTSVKCLSVTKTFTPLFIKMIWLTIKVEDNGLGF
jgi:hypothetical protein